MINYLRRKSTTEPGIALTFHKKTVTKLFSSAALAKLSQNPLGSHCLAYGKVSQTFFLLFIKFQFLISAEAINFEEFASASSFVSVLCKNIKMFYARNLLQLLKQTAFTLKRICEIVSKNFALCVTHFAFKCRQL